MEETIKQLFEKYTDECRFARRLRPETVRGYTEVFNTFSALLPEVNAPKDLTKEMMTVFFKRLEMRERIMGKERKKVGIKPSTVRTYGSKLRTFFDWLRTNRYISVNPVDDIRLPVPVYEDYRALKREEVQKIIAAISTHSISALMLRRDLAMVYVFIFCGLRRNELLSLKLSDIDPYQRLLTVQAETSKSKKTRKLHIHPTLWLHLSQYLKERKDSRKTCPYLWVAHGNDVRLTYHGLKHWVKRLVRLSGVKFHVHRFRHTFATNLGYSGASVLKIQRLMGHTQVTMTMAYLRSIQTENLTEDIEKLSIENLV